MAQNYAKNQPSGFKNYIENIAIVGAGGQVGKFITEALLAAGKHNLTAITRAGSTSPLPSGLHVAKVDYANPASLVSALQGQDALIITMGTTAPKDQQTKLIEAAAEAGVRWILPNEYGYDKADPGLHKDIPLGEAHSAYIKQIEDLGKSSWTSVACGFWYEFSLGGGEERYGFDFGKKTVTLFDDGNTKIDTSTWPQTGRGVARLLGLKIMKEHENDKSACLEDYKNKFLYFSSFCISQREMLESVLRVTGTKAGDWTITNEGSVERYNRGIEMMQQGNMVGFAQMMYTRVFYQDGSGNYTESRGVANDVLGLPKEDLDEYTAKAIEFSKKGLKYPSSV
ncbi:MAG: hypothetical protein Q9167_001010 [Letrouitia subvulpina]